MRLTNHELHCLCTCRCKDEATFRLILSADRSTWIFFFTLFKQIIVYYCKSTKNSKGYNASHNSRGAEINWKSSSKKKKTRREKMWVTDRNGYKLHQTVVCFIEPPIPKARVLRYSFANQKMSLMYLSQTDILRTWFQF